MLDILYLSKFFRTFDSDSSDSESESHYSSDESNDENVTNLRGIVSSSSDDDDSRVVRSQKDKAFANLEKHCKAIKNFLKDDLWADVAGEFDELQRQLLKSATVIKTHGFPRFYLKCVVDLETAALDLAADKQSKSFLPIADQKAHQIVSMKVKKHITQFGKQFDTYRNNPDDSDDEDVAPKKKAVKKAAPKKHGFFADDSEDEDEDEDEYEEDEDEFEEDEDEDEDEDDYDSESEIDDDIDDISLLSGKITRDFWVKKEKKEDPKAILKKEKTRRPKESKKNEEEETPTDENGQILTKAQRQKMEMLKARANEEVSPAVMAKRLREIVNSRGKRSADLNAMVNELRFLETKAHDDVTLLRVQTLLTLCLFDMHSRHGSIVTLPNWRESLSQVEVIIETLKTHPSVRLVEDDSFDDDSFEDVETDSRIDDVVEGGDSQWAARRKAMLAAAKAKAKEEASSDFDPNVSYVEGSLYSYVFKISTEYYKALQIVDHRSSEYIARLKDQARLVSLFKKARTYYQEINKPRLEARVVQIWLEYEYYFYRPELDVLNAEAKETSKVVTLVDELAEVAYRAEDPRSRVRALLFQVYHWCVHNRYEEARERLMMSHINEAINELDVSTRILYNRTVVQLGIAAFKCGEYRASFHCLSDFFTGSSRLKELLAQGVVYTKNDTREEDVNEAKRRMYPYHMHINMEIVDNIHIIAALLLEVPNIAEVGWARRIISRPFRRHYQFYSTRLGGSFSQSENPRDVLMNAARALFDGDWENCYDIISSLKMWSNVSQSEVVKSTLLAKIKREALSTFLLTNGSHYNSISLQALSAKFSLDKSLIRQVVNKMLYLDLIAGAWDSSDDNACIVITAPAHSKIQKLTIQYVDRLQLFSERLEVPNPTRNTHKIDDTTQNKQKWSERSKAKGNFVNSRGRGKNRH